MFGPVVSLDHLSKSVLAGKSDAALLLGVEWDELTPDDRMVRLVLITDPPVRDVPVLQAFLHDITRLTVKEHGKVLAHVRPSDLDIHRVHLEFEGHTYAVGHRLDASWGYLCDTHKV